MAEFTIEEIIKATGGVLLQGDPKRTITGVNTDTRFVKPGELFIALKGERFDGHDFLTTATEAGACALVISNPSELIHGVSVIQVPDTLKALGDIAYYHRQRFDIPVIGITGSNGKTTTKDLVASILSQELNIVKTEANFNNEIGLPLTLLKMTESTQAVIVEMGMRGLGQIRQLAQIAAPTIGLITNVGLTHLELLGTQENIAKAKQELIESLPESGLAILNGDDPWVRKMSRSSKPRPVFYGIDSDDLDLHAQIIGSDEAGSRIQVNCCHDKFETVLAIPGRHNVLNALAAIAVAKELGLSNRAIQAGLAEPRLTGKRLHVIEQNGYWIIDDTYNASPTSVKAALDVMASIHKGGRKIAVLADMLELGPLSPEIHHEIGVYAGKAGMDYLFAFGEIAREYKIGMDTVSEGRADFFPNKQALITRVLEYIKPGDLILVKGSRGMKMEEVVAALSREGVNVV